MPFLRNRNRPYEPIWHLQLTVLVAIILQLALPSRYYVINMDSRWILIAAEILLLVALSFTTPKQPIFRSISRRINVFLLIGAIGATNLYALARVSDKLLSFGQVVDGRELILSALNIYVTNVIIFALLYWEMDGGGPGQRLKAAPHEQDFLFPQDQNQDYKHPHWQPTFIDYLYLSSTNSMAFSPTDTMPMSRRAKLLMLGQATVSLVAIALVAARAVNILH